MSGVRLSTIGAVCAIVTTLSFVTGGILLGASAGQDLIPPTGADGLEWIADVDAASGLFFAAAWLIVATTLVGAVALVGFYACSRALAGGSCWRRSWESSGSCS